MPHLDEAFELIRQLRADHDALTERVQEAEAREGKLLTRFNKLEDALEQPAAKPAAKAPAAKASAR
jgi:chaperonin cofactor prefoldin